jgi:hypothetical protein
MAIAPDDLGRFSNALLVGNVADGHINAYNPINGASRGQLMDTTGQPFTEPGLWSLKFGNNGLAGSSATLFFTAGINGYADGLLGSLQAVPEDLSPDAAVSLGSSAPASAAATSVGLPASGISSPVIVTPADLQSFTPANPNRGNSLLHIGAPVQQATIDWANDELVKEFLSL